MTERLNPLTPVLKPIADRAAQCIGCGACVTQCPTDAAQLLTSAKVSHLNLLSTTGVLAMVEAMEQEGIGYCSNFAECEAVCPKEISIDFIARMNRDYLKARSKGERKTPLET